MEMVTAEVGKPGEPWVQPQGWAGRKQAQVALAHCDMTHPTLTRVTEKHPWLCFIPPKSVPEQTGPLTGTHWHVCRGKVERK